MSIRSAWRIPIAISWRSLSTSPPPWAAAKGNDQCGPGHPVHALLCWMADLDVTVIVPAHDAAATIGDTLSALAAQDFEGVYEVVVVDDGSSDETAAIAERAG